MQALSVSCSLCCALRGLLPSSSLFRIFPEVVREFLWGELALWKAKTAGMQFFDMRITGSVKTIMCLRTLNHSDHFFLMKLAIELCSS
ncbi:Nacht, Lrr And Pyd Domains-Containing Protein 13 [Manis pentadactyla]|nr:Nacht, Lrr And Pyd Domains-Containing Protein 13 [Manis pentadactyla]